jgi:hypothetical protein
MTADEYLPIFMEDNEQTFTPSGQKQKVNPTYCLTMDSAEELAEILQDLHPKIVEADPFPVFLGSVSFTHLVPWFVFPSGCAVNCGSTANYWPLSGNNGKIAEENARKDIAAAEVQFAAEGGGQYPIQVRPRQS